MVGLCLMRMIMKIDDDNLFVYWSVCDVTILRSSFHVDNSNAKMVGLCLMRMIMKVDAW